MERLVARVSECEAVAAAVVLASMTSCTQILYGGPRNDLMCDVRWWMCLSCAWWQTCWKMDDGDGGKPTTKLSSKMKTKYYKSNSNSIFTWAAHSSGARVFVCVCVWKWNDFFDMVWQFLDISLKKIVGLKEVSIWDCQTDWTLQSLDGKYQIQMSLLEPHIEIATKQKRSMFLFEMCKVNEMTRAKENLQWMN